MRMSFRSANIKYFTLQWLRLLNVSIYIYIYISDVTVKIALGMKHLNFCFINSNR
jgi:hypothetical protein